MQQPASIYSSTCLAGCDHLCCTMRLLAQLLIRVLQALTCCFKGICCLTAQTPLFIGLAIKPGLFEEVLLLQTNLAAWELQTTASPGPRRRPCRGPLQWRPPLQCQMLRLLA